MLLLLLLLWGAPPDCLWLRLCGVQHHWLLLLLVPAWDSMGLGLCAVHGACCALLLLLLLWDTLAVLCMRLWLCGIGVWQHSRDGSSSSTACMPACQPVTCCCLRRCWCCWWRRHVPPCCPL